MCLMMMVCGCNETETPSDGKCGLEAGVDLQADTKQPTSDAKPPTPDGKQPKPDAKQPKPDAKQPKPDQANPKDAKPPTDGGTKFPAVLDGVWLIGWSGGMHHFSWVRFSVPVSSNGKAHIIDGKKLWANAPYWNCSGATSWNTTAKPYTIQLHLPSGTCSGMKSTVLSFFNFKTPGGWPKGAILEADVNQSSPSGNIKAYKFPASQCDKAMTTCKDPLK